MPSSFHVLIKPASSLCNLSCDYCFYEDVSQRQTNMDRKIMSAEVMDAVIRQSLEMSPSGNITFGFQGGEPLIAPITFYRSFIKSVNELNTGQARISYTIQTNGMLITKEHAQFFRDEGFLVGISIDGKKDTHDYYRKTSDGQGSYEKAMQGLLKLIEHDVALNVLSVLTDESAKYVEETYHRLKEIGVTHLQFIPVIEPIGVKVQSSSYALSNDSYANSHIKLFDLYVRDLLNSEKINIRYFDNLISMNQGHRVEQCGLSGKCHSPIVVESNGNVYPCDFYCDDDHLLGNVLHEKLVELVKKERMRSFIIDALVTPKKCENCDVYDLCKAGCRRYRKHSFDSAVHELIHCEGIQVFLRHVKSIIQHPRVRG